RALPYQPERLADRMIRRRARRRCRKGRTGNAELHAHVACHRIAHRSRDRYRRNAVLFIRVKIVEKSVLCFLAAEARTRNYTNAAAELLIRSEPCITDGLTRSDDAKMSKRVEHH